MLVAAESEGRVALARIVMAHRERIIMLEPLGKGILGTTLRYDYEVRKEKEYFVHVPSPRNMIELASHILESKSTTFDPEKRFVVVTLGALSERRACLPLPCHAPYLQHPRADRSIASEGFVK